MYPERTCLRDLTQHLRIRDIFGKDAFIQPPNPRYLVSVLAGANLPQPWVRSE
jgi:hypothetical protein